MRRYLANVVACLACLAVVPVGAQPVQSAADLVQEVSRTAAAGDKVGHLAAYRKLAAFLAKDPDQHNVLGLIIKADMQRDIARAAFAIDGQDACSALDQGTAYLEQARTIQARGDETDEPEAIDDMERVLSRERRRMHRWPGIITCRE